MRVWRICRQPYAANALSGKGGFFVSGRWHTSGKPVVYAAESLALAALEVLVHVDRATAPSDFVQLEIDVPDDFTFRASAIERLRGDAFPVSWTLQIEDVGDANLPCLASGEQKCTFKIGSSNRDVLVVATSDCQASDANLSFSGVVTMKASKYLDISRSDAIVRPLN